MNTVSVILPSYNESKSITEAIDRISNCLSDRLLEIIVIDDNSPDGTSQVVEQHQHPKIRLITRENETGLASALEMGTRLAAGELITWLDCDLGIPPENIPKLLDHLTEYDIAIGSRYLPTGKDLRPFWRSCLSYLLNWFSRVILGSDVTDYSSGFIAIRKEVLTLVQINPDAIFGEYFIEFVFHCQKADLRIVEIPYLYHDRPFGVSKSSSSLLTVARLGWVYVIKVIKLRLSNRLN